MLSLRTFATKDLECITKLMADVRISSEVFAYMQNLIAFLRLHRAVSGGISALATRHFELLTRSVSKDPLIEMMG